MIIVNRPPTSGRRLPQRPRCQTTHHAVRSFVAFLALGLTPQLGSAADDWIEDPITGCRIWTDEVDTFRETATWSGPCQDGTASGEGVLVWFKDDDILGRYVGAMRAGKLHGRGVLHYRRPDTIAALRADIADETLDEGRIVYHYEGVMRAGKLQGRGVLYYRTNRGFDRYEGEFRDGEIDGEVVYESARGDRFEGRTRGVDGTGEGVYSSASGERYEGAFAGGEPTGRGTYTAPNGDVFEADFVDGKAHGDVEIIRVDGSREVVRWEHGRPVGQVGGQ